MIPQKWKHFGNMFPCEKIGEKNVHFWGKMETFCIAQETFLMGSFTYDVIKIWAFFTPLPPSRHQSSSFENPPKISEVNFYDDVITVKPPPPTSCQNTLIFGLEIAFLFIRSLAIVVIPSRQLFIFLASTILPEERESVFSKCMS